jgi:tagaturonate reductase
LTPSVHFADTLVDRIVTEPVGAIAEPYALWAIRRANFVLFTHPAIVMTDDLEPFERLKLYILNLGHTVLAEEWLRAGCRAGETVR